MKPRGALKLTIPLDGFSQRVYDKSKDIVLFILERAQGAPNESKAYPNKTSAQVKEEEK